MYMYIYIYMERERERYRYLRYHDIVGLREGEGARPHALLAATQLDPTPSSV